MELPKIGFSVQFRSALIIKKRLDDVDNLLSRHE